MAYWLADAEKPDRYMFKPIVVNAQDDPSIPPIVPQADDVTTPGSGSAEPPAD